MFLLCDTKINLSHDVIEDDIASCFDIKRFFDKTTLFKLVTGSFTAVLNQT